MTVSIESMTAADAARCAYLETVLFPGDDPWAEDAFIAELAAPQPHCLRSTAPEPAFSISSWTRGRRWIGPEG